MAKEERIFQQSSQPWWRIKLFVWEPVLFGTWDGVFTTCMINIFGVVLFLRTGYLVGNTGVLLGMFLVSMVVAVALVTVFSGGGIYSMISTSGGRVGGTVGLLYVFGQCVAGAMYITGFSESVAELLGLQGQWAVRAMSLAVLLALLGINLAVSTLDFVIGTFAHLDPEHGFVGYSEQLLRRNSLPDYSTGENFFTVFGVFFPAATGVMAGFNMSSDLQRPEHNIPVVPISGLCLLLGAICTRETLRYDFLIAEKVSLVGFLFLLGLYISSLASCMGGLYGAPRILQCIAQERVIPVLAFLGQGKGPNKTPVAAICLTSLLTMAFVLIGQVNILAPIVTINFMLTYSFIDYSFFCVAMTCQLQNKDKKSTFFMKQNNSRKSRSSSRPLCESTPPDYGSGGESPQGNGTLLAFTNDLNQIFPNECGSVGNDPVREHKVKGKTTQADVKEMLMKSFVLNSEQINLFEDKEEKRRAMCDKICDLYNKDSVDSAHFKHIQENEREDTFMNCYMNSRITCLSEHVCQRINCSRFYFCNHWLALIGAISSIVIMFVIEWIYALVNISVALVIFFYIGKTSPGLPAGMAARFSFFTWLKTTLKTIGR
uniref:Solute carrier family 12 member 8 n=1 Tax=Neogobius melanostomus TaxID=47308 RepID=A0A8C6T4G9_9GOBI